MGPGRPAGGGCAADIGSGSSTIGIKAGAAARRLDGVSGVEHGDVGAEGDFGDFGDAVGECGMGIALVALLDGDRVGGGHSTIVLGEAVGGEAVIESGSRILLGILLGSCCPLAAAVAAGRGFGAGILTDPHSASADGRAGDLTWAGDLARAWPPTLAGGAACTDCGLDAGAGTDAGARAGCDCGESVGRCGSDSRTSAGVVRMGTSSMQAA